MKLMSGIILVLMLTSSLLWAQTNQQETRMEVMETVVPLVSIDTIQLKFTTSKDDSYDAVQLSPMDDNSGLIVISGRPYSIFQIRIPAETHLENQYGEDAVLINHQLIRGAENEADLMEAITPAACSELSIPETGMIYIRIGGKVESEESLRGIYTGILNLDCVTE